MIDASKKSVETQLVARNDVAEKKVGDVRTPDVANLTARTASLSAQVSGLRETLQVAGNMNWTADNPVAWSMS